MQASRLRVYVNPLDAPGRAKGSFETTQALCTATQQEETLAMEEVRRELERARMTAEDYAQGDAVMHRYRDGAGVAKTETWRQMNQNPSLQRDRDG